jgi:transposase
MISIPKSEYENLQSAIILLQDQLTELKRMIFGVKSEKFIPSVDNQLGLFGQTPHLDTIEPVTEHISFHRTKASKENKQPVRGILPAHLSRVEEIIEPDNLEADAQCIGEQVTEILEYNPAKLFVRKIVRPKYALKNQGGIVIGELPTLPIPKSNAGASLLAHITVSKFVDHLPFYRQRQIFKRQDFQVSDSTLGGWFNATADLLAPLYEVLQKEVLKSNYIQADESPIGVQDSHKSGSLHTGYQWVYRAPVEGLVMFRYHKNRSRLAAIEVLNNFSGALQTDGYKVYQNLQTQGEITLLGCMAHARRYFEKALDNDKNRAEHALMLFQKLYAIERKARNRSVTTQTRKRYRDLCATPILNQMERWLKEQINLVLPKSLIAKAIRYTLNLWENLKRYTLDGKFEIDNNMVENTIRPLALGRKNYLFAGSHKAAQKAAMFYSFFATCKINNVEPLQWLTHVLNVIPDYKVNKLSELLPNNYQN